MLIQGGIVLLLLGLCLLVVQRSSGRRLSVELGGVCACLLVSSVALGGVHGQGKCPSPLAHSVNF